MPVAVELNGLLPGLGPGRGAPGRGPGPPDLGAPGRGAPGALGPRRGRPGALARLVRTTGGGTRALPGDRQARRDAEPRAGPGPLAPLAP